MLATTHLITHSLPWVNFYSRASRYISIAREHHEGRSGKPASPSALGRTSLETTSEPPFAPSASIDCNVSHQPETSSSHDTPSRAARGSGSHPFGPDGELDDLAGRVRQGGAPGTVIRAPVGMVAAPTAPQPSVLSARVEHHTRPSRSLARMLISIRHLRPPNRRPLSTPPRASTTCELKCTTERYALVTRSRNANEPLVFVQPRSENRPTFALTQDAPALTNGRRWGERQSTRRARCSAVATQSHGPRQ